MSLLALSSVVSALAAKGLVVPFRNSKLTRLLQSSLAGNCKAAFVVTLRSEKANIEEALVTLRFAQRAKAVQATVLKNEDARKPKANEHNKKLQDELAAARKELAAFQNMLAGADSVKDELQAQVHSLLDEMKALQRDGAKAKASKRGGHHMDPEQYIRELEAENARLEEENRILRQRDIMHRLVGIGDKEAGGGLANFHDASNLATFATPVSLGGFAQMAVNDTAFSEREFRPEQPVQMLNRHEGNGTRTKWSLLRIPMLLTRKPSKVAPLGAGAPPPSTRQSSGHFSQRGSMRREYAPPWRPKTKQEKAAVYIQKVWRGHAVRKDIDDDPWADMYDDMYDDDDY
jgi:hypothetical protein